MSILNPTKCDILKSGVVFPEKKNSLSLLKKS
jgi:hypothetical protein